MDLYFLKKLKFCRMFNLFSFINKQKCKIWTCVTTTKTLGIGLRSQPLSTSPSNIIKWCCAFTNNLVFNIKSTNIIDGVDDAHFIAFVSISTILPIVLNFVKTLKFFKLQQNTTLKYYRTNFDGANYPLLSIHTIFTS